MILECEYTTNTCMRLYYTLLDPPDRTRCTLQKVLLGKNNVICNNLFIFTAVFICLCYFGNLILVLLTSQDFITCILFTGGFTTRVVKEYFHLDIARLLCRYFDIIILGRRLIWFICVITVYVYSAFKRLSLSLNVNTEIILIGVSPLVT